jgi:hypothetical protein
LAENKRVTQALARTTKETNNGHLWTTKPIKITFGMRSKQARGWSTKEATSLVVAFGSQHITIQLFHKARIVLDH